VASTFELFDQLSPGEWKSAGSEENCSRDLACGEPALFPCGVCIACLGEPDRVAQSSGSLADLASPVGPSLIVSTGRQKACPPARLVRKDLPVTDSPARQVISSLQTIQELSPAKNVGIDLVWEVDWPDPARQNYQDINVTG
jgi:hypothetical protein